MTLGAIRYWHPQPRPPRPTADMAQMAHADLSSRARLDADVAVDAGNSRAVPGTGEPPTLSAPPPNEPADRASPRADAKVDAGPGGSAAVTPPTSLAGSPGDGRSREVPPQKAFSAKNQLARGLVPVRFVVEPAVVNATVVCKAGRTSCKGSCSIGIPRGVSCQLTARGYHDKLVRFSDLRINQGSRFFRVVLSPFKL